MVLYRFVIHLWIQSPIKSTTNAANIIFLPTLPVCSVLIKPVCSFKQNLPFCYNVDLFLTFFRLEYFDFLNFFVELHPTVAASLFQSLENSKITIDFKLQRQKKTFYLLRVQSNFFFSSSTDNIIWNAENENAFWSLRNYEKEILWIPKTSIA